MSRAVATAFASRSLVVARGQCAKAGSGEVRRQELAINETKQCVAMQH
jgi:hypothetical protein